MTKLRIKGGNRLTGELKVSGAKNAAIAIIPAALAVPGEHVLENVPDVLDVRVITEILGELGAEADFRPQKNTLRIDTSTVDSTTAPYELVRKMRASFLVLGPLVARFGHARVALPGGCRIGLRPVDMHLKGLRDLGAEVEVQQGEVVAETDRLEGDELTLEKISVGTTENLMIAATLAKGETTIYNAATEPEVVDLANYLKACGAEIEGAGTRRLEIRGQDELDPPERYRVISDRVEAGTWLIAAAATRGDATFTELDPEYLKALLEELEAIGVRVQVNGDEITVNPNNGLLPASLRSQEYPGFPTDLQPQMITLLTQAQGLSVVTETIFENRFTHVPELKRMGARIEVRGNSAIVEGNGRLSGVPVEACDIRGGAALMIAGLMAEGVTEIEGKKYIDRGYERLTERLRQLGAEVETVESDD